VEKHLHYPCAGSCSNDGRRRAHIEHVVAVAASPDHVHDEVYVRALDRRFQRPPAQDIRGGHETFRPALDALNVQRGQERADLRRERGVRGEDVLERKSEIVRTKVLWRLYELEQNRLERVRRVAGHRGVKGGA
jgi:hypothetical protein